MREVEVNMDVVETLARATDSLMRTSAEERGLFESYVDTIVRVGNAADDCEEELAMELLLQTATLLNDDAKSIIEDLICPDDVATQIFVDYYHEYIMDGYVIDRILNAAGVANDSDEEEIEEEFEDDEEDADALINVLDEAYEMLKSCLTSEVETDDGCKGCCCM